MAAPPQVFQFIGAVFTAILYGLYCLIFGLFLRIQYRRKDRMRSMLLLALTAIFILCTAYFIILIILVQFDITGAVTVVTELENSLKHAVNGMTIAIDAIYTAIDFISQLILLYRCWVMWLQPLVMVIPCLLSLAFLVTALTTFVFNIKIQMQSLSPAWYYSAVTAFFILSLAVNALVTAMIVYKIITVYHDIREFNDSNVQLQASAYRNGRRDIYYPLISILIGSGLITVFGQLAQSIMYKVSQVAFPLVGGSVVMLYGISSTVVLVRIEIGISYDHNTTTTTDPSNHDSGRPVQLSAFVPKLNPEYIDDPKLDDPKLEEARKRSN